MPRANRYHVSGLIWHITHRCLNKEFLLKLTKDRQRYRHWLLQAKVRYDLCVLNYITTRNHIHLIVYDSGRPSVIESSMQYSQGRMAQEYNRHNQRTGAYWQDRYHATAVQSHRHLRRCMTYVDMNMVRAGVVAHPSQWSSAGYHEIQSPRSRYRLLDLERLMELLGFSSHHSLARWQNEQIEAAIANPKPRESCWTSAVAVGDHAFLKDVAQRLGGRSRFLKISGPEDSAILAKDPNR